LLPCVPPCIFIIWFNKMWAFIHKHKPKWIGSVSRNYNIIIWKEIICDPFATSPSFNLFILYVIYFTFNLFLGFSLVNVHCETCYLLSHSSSRFPSRQAIQK
jgi:hypothetical protein